MDWGFRLNKFIDRLSAPGYHEEILQKGKGKQIENKSERRKKALPAQTISWKLEMENNFNPNYV